VTVTAILGTDCASGEEGGDPGEEASSGLVSMAGVPNIGLPFASTDLNGNREHRKCIRGRVCERWFTESGSASRGSRKVTRGGAGGVCSFPAAGNLTFARVLCRVGVYMN
jgi:hypothetical protein